MDLTVEGVDGHGGYSQLAFPRLHDRTITRLLHVPEHHLLLTLSFDAYLRAHDALSVTIRYAWRNGTGCLFTGLGYDLAHSQVWHGGALGLWLVLVWLNVAACLAMTV